MVDDWGWDLWPGREASTLDTSGSVRQLLPHATRWLADEGLMLSRHYAYHSCAPSRQALLSGRLPIHQNQDNAACSSVPRNVPTLADAMRGAGYATHFLGKWHCGFLRASLTPTRRGFDSSLGFFLRGHGHASHCAASLEKHSLSQHQLDQPVEECAIAPHDVTRATLYDFFVGQPDGRGDVAVREADHPAIQDQLDSSQLYGDTAVRLIGEHDASRPFFLYVAFSATHVPYSAPAAVREAAEHARASYDYAACGWANGASPCDAGQRRLYEAMAHGVDAQLGRMVEALKARDMWATTLLVFSSDNGGAPGNQGSNLPLQGGKLSTLEGGMRTLTALGGGWLPSELRGATSHAFMHVADWYATLSHVAGVPLPTETRGAAPIESVSLWPAWLALQTRRRQRQQDGNAPDDSDDEDADASLGRTRLLLSSDSLIDVQPAAGSSRAAAYKLVTGYACESKPPRDESEVDACPAGQPRLDAATGRLRCGCLSCGDDGCLFELISDPAEAHDLARQLPEVRAALRRQLELGRASAVVDEWQSGIADIDGCTSCGKCKGVFLDFAADHGHVIQPLVLD